MFDHREIAQAQILSKVFYEKRVSEVQTKIRKLDRPFLFYFRTEEEYFDTADYFYIGCYDMNSKNLFKLACEVQVLGCIQIRSSLFTYDETGEWSST